MPIQPRNDLCPDLEVVFHVTNIGYDSVTDRREAHVGAISLIDVVLVNWVCDEFTDMLDGVDTLDLEEGVRSRSRETDGNCNCPFVILCCSSIESVPCPTATSSCTTSTVVSSPFNSFCH